MNTMLKTVTMTHIIFLLGAVTILNFAGIAFAHNPNQLALRELAYVPDDRLPVIDGKISPGEYDWAPAKFKYKLSDYLAYRQPTGVGPYVLVADPAYSAQDFDVPFVFLGWSPKLNALVIAVQTIDDVGFFPWSYYETYKGMDAIYWYMDADHDGGQYQYYNPPRSGVDGQQGIFRADANRGGRPDLPMWGAYDVADSGAWAFREPYVRSAVTIDEATGSYTVETTMQIWDWLDKGGPSASVPHIMKQGEIIGMGFGIIDSDNLTATDGVYFTWASKSYGGNPAFTSNGFNNWILLSPEETGVPTAVESSSWGRLKTTFR